MCLLDMVNTGSNIQTNQPGMEHKMRYSVHKTPAGKRYIARPPTEVKLGLSVMVYTRGILVDQTKPGRYQSDRENTFCLQTENKFQLHRPGNLVV